MIQTGTRVRLNTPDNARLHGAAATVEAVTPWGAHVRTAAAATGQFRALSAEMRPEPVAYTGNCCDTCGSVRLRRAGACLVCEDCGSNSGCG
jgi:hypothetical protein